MAHYTIRYDRTNDRVAVSPSFRERTRDEYAAMHEQVAHEIHQARGTDLPEARLEVDRAVLRTASRGAPS